MTDEMTAILCPTCEESIGAAERYCWNCDIPVERPLTNPNRWRSEFTCGCDSYTTLFRPVVGQLVGCHAHGSTRVRVVERVL